MTPPLPYPRRRTTPFQGGGSPYVGPSNTFAIVYGRDESQYESLPQHDDLLPHGVVTATTAPAPNRARQRDAVPGTTRLPVPRGAADCAGSTSSLDSSYSSFNSPTATDNELPTQLPQPPARGLDGLPYNSQPLSYDKPSGALRQVAGTSGGLTPSLPTPFDPRFSDGGGSGSMGGGGTSVAAGQRRGSEEQPLLAHTMSRVRRDGGGGGADASSGGAAGAAGPDDDDDGRKQRRGCTGFLFRTAAACPAPELLPLLAWRGCLAACRCVCLLACYPW
jgi:hypothetical protein